MEPTAILYPAIAMFSLTLGVTLYLGANRYSAIHRRDVSIKYFRTYNEGDQPARLHLLARHVQNHFEIPPLFHIATAFIFMSGSVSVTSVVLAWLYFGCRCLHTYIHLGSNNVSRRFFTFGVSLFFLAGLWVHLLVSLMRP